jgi:hypothetical protein
MRRRDVEDRASQFCLWFERVGGVLGDRVEIGPWAHILLGPTSGSSKSPGPSGNMGQRQCKYQRN